MLYAGSSSTGRGQHDVDRVVLSATKHQQRHIAGSFRKTYECEAVAMSLSEGLVTRQLRFSHGSDGFHKWIGPFVALLLVSLRDPKRLLTYKVIDSSLFSASLVNSWYLAVRK
jgi:hypothetical protein